MWYLFFGVWDGGEGGVKLVKIIFISYIILFGILVSRILCLHAETFSRTGYKTKKATTPSGCILQQKNSRPLKTKNPRLVRQ